MRHQGQRKSTPRVTNGNVRKKNDWTLSPDYYDAPIPRMVMIDRRRPREGFKHVLTTPDIYRFLDLLPDWNTLAVGLNAIVMSRGSNEHDGLYCRDGVVWLGAWPAGLWAEFEQWYVDEHRDIFDRLEVECVDVGPDAILCKFDEWSVKAYQLLHILLHELGHHQDRMTTRRQLRTARGEPYAEDYARRYEAQIWDSYLRAFRR